MLKQRGRTLHSLRLTSSLPAMSAATLTPRLQLTARSPTGNKRLPLLRSRHGLPGCQPRAKNSNKQDPAYRARQPPISSRLRIPSPATNQPTPRPQAAAKKQSREREYERRRAAQVTKRLLELDRESARAGVVREARRRARAGERRLGGRAQGGVLANREGKEERGEGGWRTDGGDDKTGRPKK